MKNHPSHIVKPLTSEEIWGVPPEQLPKAEKKKDEQCPVAEGYCSFFENGCCQATHCVIKEYNG